MSGSARGAGRFRVRPGCCTKGTSCVLCVGCKSSLALYDMDNVRLFRVLSFFSFFSFISPPGKGARLSPLFCALWLPSIWRKRKRAMNTPIGLLLLWLLLAGVFSGGAGG